MQRPLIKDLHPLLSFLFYACIAGISLIVITLISALLILGLYGFDTLMEIMNGAAPVGNLQLNAYRIIMASQNIGLFILPALLFAFISSPSIKKYLYLAHYPWQLIFLCLPLMFFLFPVINWLAEINSQMVFPELLKGVEQQFMAWEETATQTTEQLLVMDGIGDLILNVLIIGVLTAIGEELCFRGIIQKFVAKWVKNIHVAVWVTGFLFSAIHFQFYGFLPRFLLGVLLGYLLVWSGSIWVPIFVHFLNNATAVVLSYFIQQGTISEEIETAGESNFMFTFFAFLIALGICYLFWKKSTVKLSDNYIRS